jgi:uncharacterized phiE125 gp8 family phage protein
MMWDRLRRIGGAPLALTADEVKTHLGIDTSDFDTWIAAKLIEAQAYVEGPHGVGVILTDQTWRLSLDGWPGCIRIPLYPVASVDSITYRDADGVEQTLDEALYQYDLDANPVEIVRTNGQAWPSHEVRPGAIKVNFTAGFAADSPEPPELALLKGALVLLIGHWFANREAVNVGNIVTDLPHGLDAILNRFRVGQVA